MESKVSFSFGLFLLFGIVFSQSSTHANSEYLQMNGGTYALNNPRAEGDEVTEKPGGGYSGRTGSTSQQCEANGVCCAMYTYPGNKAMDDQDTAPQICSQLPAIKDDPASQIACFGPLVYSNGSRRPDPKLVTEECVSKNLPCFCSSDTCLKYTYIVNNKERTIQNETRFCGTLTNIETNSPVTSGCYTETIEGSPYLREVCVCKSKPGQYCNSSKASEILSSLPVVSILIMSLFSYALRFC